MSTSDPPADLIGDPLLQTFGERIQALVTDFIMQRKMPLPEVAGALIGAGVELSIRNGINRTQIHQSVDLIIAMIERRASA